MESGPDSRRRPLGGTPLHRGMANIASGNHVDHVLGDVRGVVGDALRILFPRHYQELAGADFRVKLNGSEKALAVVAGL